jgi:hypothetical protein
MFNGWKLRCRKDVVEICRPNHVFLFFSFMLWRSFESHRAEKKSYR